MGMWIVCLICQGNHRMRTIVKEYPLRLGFEYSISRDMIKMLLDAGADVNAYDADGYPLIFYSVRRDNDRLFCMLRTMGRI